MKLSAVLVATAFGIFASANITYKINKASNPTPDQTDAYTKIAAAMDAAIARHDALGCAPASKTLNVEYNTGVATADGSSDGTVRFGSNRAFMTERTALHEIAHTLGVGTSTSFTDLCASGNWKTALPLLKSWDGDDATITCGGGHFWPYGLNFETEMSDTNADRNVEIVNAMIADGLVVK